MSNFELYQISWKEWLVLAITLVLAFVLLSGASLGTSDTSEVLQSINFE